MGLRKLSGKWIFFIAIAILIAGVLVSQHYNVSFPPKQGEVFTIFKSKNPALDFTFEYPSLGWTPKESQGATQKYDAVQVLGPSDIKKEYSAYISVGVRTLKPEQLNADSLSLLAEETKRFKGFKIIEEKQIRIHEQDYPSITFEHFLRLPFWKKNAKDVLIKKTIVFLTRRDRSYRISFAGTAQQFKAYELVFDHALQTFKFKD